MKNVFRELHRRSMWQVLGIYLVSAWAVLQVVDTLADVLNLPSWAPSMALFLLIVGLPIVLATAFVQGGMRSRDDPASPESGRGTPGEPGSVEAGASDAPALKELFTWRNALGGGVLALALWGAVSAAWLFWFRPRPLTGAVAVGAEVIAVVPFTVAGTQDLTGEGIVDLLSASLDQVGPIRTVAPQTVLARWERAARDGRPDLATSLEIARLVEAGSVLTGSVVAAGSEVRVDATLHAVSGNQLGRTRISGRTESLLTLVDSLSLALLREIWLSNEPVPNLRVSAITTGDLDAIRAYLEGLRHYRQVDYPAAVEDFTRAVEEDSTFALAHLRLADTYAWTASFPTNRAERLRRRALHTRAASRHADRLPDRERSLVDIQLLALSGDRATLQDSLEAFVQRYPDDAVAWYRVGDTRYHAYEGFLTEPTELMAPFERVVELDPTARTLYSHLPPMILAFADSAAFHRHLEAMERIGDPSVPGLRALRTALWGSATATEAVQALARVPEGLDFSAVHALAFRTEHGPRAVAEALDELARGLAPRSPLQPALDDSRERLWSALGNLEQARALQESLGLDPWEAYERAARPVLAGIADRSFLLPDPGPTASDPQRRYLWLALDALDAGDSDLARRHIDTGLSQVPEFERLDFEALYGAARGRADVVDGDSVSGLRSMEDALSGPAPGSYLNVIQRGDRAASALVYALAAGLASRPDTRARGLRLLSMPWTGSWEYEVLSRYHRGRAMEAQGDAAGAREAYAWFVDALSGAEAGLSVEELVEDARARSERLPAPQGA